MNHPELAQVRLERVLYALSDEVRLAIVRRLARDGVSSCAALSGDRPKSSMSHHFKVLRDCGLIRTRCEGVLHLNELRREELDARFPGLLACVVAVPEN